MTATNSSTKALLRKSGDRVLYVWLSQDGLEEEPLHRQGMFRVNVAVLSDGGAPEFEAEFIALDAALANASGKDDGRLARETGSVPIEEWPQERPVGATITCEGWRIPRLRRARRATNAETAALTSGMAAHWSSPPA